MRGESAVRLSFGFVVLALSLFLPRAAASGDPAGLDCGRYEMTPKSDLLGGQDPFALRCVISERIDSFSSGEIEFARILLASAERNDRAVLELAEQFFVSEIAPLQECKKVRRLAAEVYRDIGNYDAYLRLRRESESQSACQPLKTEPITRTSVRVTGVGKNQDVRRLPSGHLSLTVTIGDQALDAMIDTGSEVSVISASAARNLGLLRLSDDVGTAAALFGRFAGHLAVAPVMEVGGLRFENLLIFVADDALTDAVGFQFILGRNVLVAVGGVALLDNGRRIRLGDLSRCAQSGAEMFQINGQSRLTLEFKGGPATGFLDTGSPRSIAFAHRVPFYAAELKLVSDRRFYVAKDGTPFEQGSMTGVRRARLSLAGEQITMRELPAPRVSKPSKLGPLLIMGADLLYRIDTLILDFKAMRYHVSRRKNERLSACILGAEQP